ncbi:hypothetical protein GYA93_16565 [Gordonia desulfuricans]|uniref:Uncharacterized protein n=1 Tax=Gordonia desulfuricans TaxID=89051 RepID=A0A7K3LSH1_9ACTN|nr:hypothetical protein [Gordonia desulfuricans]NDK91180.1 hypothetical protein [Gordonia desulfuricans]
MVDSETGRRRKYCKRSCRQRAYEQRAQLTGSSIPGASGLGLTIPPDAVILSASDVADFGDRMFALRCAAEDLATAVDEDADTATLAGLASELLARAREAERLR